MTRGFLTRRGVLASAPLFLLAASRAGAADPLTLPAGAAVLPDLPGRSVSAMAVAGDNDTLAVGVRDDEGRHAGLYSISLSRPSGYHRWLSRSDGLKVHSVGWAPGRGDRLAFVLRDGRAETGYETALWSVERGADPVKRCVLARERNPVQRDGRSVSVVWAEDDVLVVHRHGLGSLEKLTLSEGRPSRFYALEAPLERLRVAGLRVAGPGVLEFVRYTSDSVNTPRTGPPAERLRVNLRGEVVDRKALAAGVADVPFLAAGVYVYGSHFEPEFQSTRVFEAATNRLVYSVPLRSGRTILNPLAISPDGRRLVCLAVPLDRSGEPGRKQAVVLDIAGAV